MVRNKQKKRNHCHEGDEGGGRRRKEDKQIAVHLFVELQDGSLVTTAVAVVGSTEDRDDGLLVGPVVTFDDKLVSTGHEVEAVVAVELL